MKLVIGENNRIAAGLSDVQVIGNDVEVSEDNQTILRHIIITETSLETSQPVSVPLKTRRGYASSNFGTDENKDVYFVDTSGGNVVVTLAHRDIAVTIIKVAAANTITYTSSTATINVSSLTSNGSGVRIFYDNINNTYFGI